MDTLYKKMLDTAEAFQLEYKDRGSRDKWYPRLKSLVSICQTDITSVNKSDYPIFQLMVDVMNAISIYVNDYKVDPGIFIQEHMYFMFFMERRFALKWNFLIENWIPIELTLQQYCIKEEIPLYTICTDPNQSTTVLRQTTSLNMEELLKFNPIETKNEVGVQWFICNMTYHNVKLYSYHPITRKWNEIKYPDHELSE